MKKVRTIYYVLLHNFLYLYIEFSIGDKLLTLYHLII